MRRYILSKTNKAKENKGILSELEIFYVTEAKKMALLAVYITLKKRIIFPTTHAHHSMKRYYILNGKTTKSFNEKQEKT